MHICFVALKALGVLRGGPLRGQIGGAEVQQMLLARALRDRGHDVTFVVNAADELPPVVDGIRLQPAYRPDAGLPGVRFVHPRWTGLHAALTAVNADVYYQRGAGSESGQVAWYCRRSGRPFIFAVGSNSDVNAELPALGSRRERWLYRYGLARAACVIVQTEHQREALRDSFGCPAELIRSIAPAAAPPARLRAGCGSPPRILWVGRLSPEKRAEWLIEIAERRPDWRFDLVGDANVDSPYAASLRLRAAGCSNVTLHGVVPYENMPARYDAADLLLSTSAWEGFPNTYLEAWSRGVPAVATFDPDGRIAEHGLGWVGASVAELIAGVERFVADAGAYQATARRAEGHVRSEHSAGRAVSELERVLSAVVRTPQPDAPERTKTTCAAS